MYFVHCDICGSSDYWVLGPVAGNQLVRCKVCGHLYMPNRYRPEELKAIYVEEYFKDQYIKENEKVQYDYLADKPNILKFAKRRYETIGKYMDPGKVLDVGCAMGFYLEHAKSLGWDVYGIEVSEYAATYARELLQTEHIYHKGIEEAVFEVEQFDLITLWLVFEHMNEPVEVLNKLAAWLKPNGILALKVPHADGITFRSNLKQWLSQHPADHMCDYTVDTLRRLAAKAGFELLEHETEGIYIDRFSKAIDHVDSPLVTDFYESLCQKNDLGDSLVAYFRKC